MNFAVIIFFVVALFAQLLSGIPIVPLFLFWQITTEHTLTVTQEFFVGTFWAIITGVSLGMLVGNMVYWSVVSLAGTLLLIFVRNYVFTAHTLPALTILLLLMLTTWRIANSRWALQELIIIGGLYLAIFFLSYALAQSKKSHQGTHI